MNDNRVGAQDFDAGTLTLSSPYFWVFFGWVYIVSPPKMFAKISLVGGFNHLEKYESQWEGLSHI